jgi:hypothetical protein
MGDVKKVVCFILLSLATLLNAQAQSASSAPGAYTNATYRFSVDVPTGWKLYGQIVDDTLRHKAIADWGLPTVYSDLEQADIENSISISAYKKATIKTVDELIQAEYLRLDPSNTAMEIDSTTANARLIYSTRNGLKYKGKSYFVFKNGIGYIVNFMATPGTFDKNIAIFERFYKAIRFL